MTLHWLRHAANAQDAKRNWMVEMNMDVWGRIQALEVDVYRLLEIQDAAVALVEDVLERYDIDVEGLECPYMRALAELVV